MYTLAFTVSNKFLFPIMAFEWYFLPLLGPYMLVASAGLVRVGKLIRVSPARYTFVAALIILAVFLPVLARQRDELMKNVRGRELLYVELAKSLMEYGARQDVVAAPEIGALGYSYPGPILDVNGLVSPQAVGQRFTDLVRSNMPPWIVSYDTLVPDELSNAVWFQREYRPVRELTNWEGRKATLFRRYAQPNVGEGRGLKLGMLAQLEDYRVVFQEVAGQRLLHLQLIWRAQERQSQRYTMFVHLVDGKGSRVAQQDNEPQEGTRPTTSWEEGERIIDRFDLSLPPGADLGDASLEVGAYRTGNPAAMLDWQSRAGAALGTRLRLPVVQPGLKMPSCELQWADGIGLQGALIRVEEATGRVAIPLIWQALAPVSQDYTVFVHLLDGRGNLVAQHDGQPRAATFPTSIWLTGDVVLDEHIIPVQAAALPSVKRIAIGMYDPKTGRRLTLASDAKVDALDLPLASPFELAQLGDSSPGKPRELDLCSLGRQ